MDSETYLKSVWKWKIKTLSFASPQAVIYSIVVYLLYLLKLYIVYKTKTVDNMYMFICANRSFLRASGVINL